MILTEIEKIDSLAEEVLGYESCFIRVDRCDYEAVKRDSATLKAVSIRGRCVDDELLTKLDAELEQAGRANLSRIFLSIGCSSVDDVSYDDAMSVLRVVENGSEHPNLVWGIGEDVTCNANDIRITLILGYNKLLLSDKNFCDVLKIRAETACGISPLLLLCGYHTH